MSAESYVTDCVETFHSITNKPELYLSAPDGHTKKVQTLLKSAYDFTKSSENGNAKFNSLPELIIDGFDVEQIWQQIELQNDGYLTHSVAKVSKLAVAKDKLLFGELGAQGQDDEEQGDVDEEQGDGAVEDESEMESEQSDNAIEEDLNDFDDIADASLSEEILSNDEEHQYVDEEQEEEIESVQSDADENQEEEIEIESDQSDDELSEKEPTSNSEKKKIKHSIVDDQFFKLDEMEEFLNAEEKKLNDQEPDSGNDSEGDSNEDEDMDADDDLDLFKADFDDIEDTAKERGGSKNPKYKDFFSEASNEESMPKRKRNKFLEEQDELDQDEDNQAAPPGMDVDEAENDAESEANEGVDEDIVKSSLQLREERLKRRMHHLEEAAVGEKPWQLKGEITAEGRPQNSLLQEVVEFDLTTRPAPVMTEQTTMQLEDVIRQRIKDKAFDSVERKAKPVETPLDYKKKLVLDQEKSKQSLAQIYEKEFMDQKEALDPDAADKEEEEPPLHKEIKLMLHGLFSKLDALSNFHFTPKPAAPELRVISNLPVIAMEEVAPVAESTANQLAPEEVKGKLRGDAIGKSERTATDKKRERRKKKLKQKKHALLNLKKQISMKPGLGNKYSKEKAKKMLEQVTKDRNVDKMDESSGSKSLKSSTAFFTQLQDEVRSQIKAKAKTKVGKNKNEFNAKKMKL